MIANGVLELQDLREVVVLRDLHAGSESVLDDRHVVGLLGDDVPWQAAALGTAAEAGGWVGGACSEAGPTVVAASIGGLVDLDILSATIEQVSLV